MCGFQRLVRVGLRSLMPAALVCAALAAAPARASVVLVAYYRLDDTGTAIQDSGPNALHGTRAVGNASTGNPGVTHVEGTAAAGFASSANHTVNLGAPGQLHFVPQTDEFSASAWIRFSSTNLNANQVYHVAMSVTASGVALFVDGNRVATGAPGTAATPGQTVYIGARTDGAGFLMQSGWIDDLQVYRGALDPGQVKVLSYTPGLAADAGAVYREIFPNDNGPDVPSASEGWVVHYGSSAASTAAPLVQGGYPTAYDADRAPVRSNPGDTGAVQGYLNNYGGPHDLRRVSLLDRGAGVRAAAGRVS